MHYGGFPGSSDESATIGKLYDRGLIRRMVRYLRPYIWLVTGATLFLVGASGMVLIPPYVTMIIVDNAIPGKDWTLLGWMGVLLMLTLITRFALTYASTWLTQLLGQRIMFDLRSQIFAHIQKLPLRYSDTTPVGKTVTRLTSDVQSLNEMFTSGVVALFGDVFQLLGIVCVLFWKNWQLALVTFTVLPFIFLVTFFFNRVARKCFRAVRRWTAEVLVNLNETITGIQIIQVFNHQERSAAHFDEKNQALFKANRDTVSYYAIYWPAISLLTSIAIGLVIWYGAGEYFAGVLTLGVLIAFISYVQQFFRPIQDLSDKFNIFQGAMAAAERIFTVLDSPTEPLQQGTTVPAEIFRQRIEFRNVVFAYKPGEPVLKDVSFTIDPGKTTAVVGATGAGKSTLASLICRFYDIDAGAIKIGDQDIRAFDPREYRKHIGLVLQDVFLFAGTIEENITLNNPDISHERVMEAARLVNIAPFIESLPEGYASYVGERGASLSQGQRQLLSFARALVYNPAVLILDEATASVDSETEGLIQDALAKLLAGRTSIVVAHRLSTIQRADRILVLHHGKLAEQGNHAELLARGGLYATLYQLQYRNGDSTTVQANPPRMVAPAG